MSISAFLGRSMVETGFLLVGGTVETGPIMAVCATSDASRLFSFGPESRHLSLLMQTSLYPTAGSASDDFDILVPLPLLAHFDALICPGASCDGSRPGRPSRAYTLTFPHRRPGLPCTVYHIARFCLLFPITPLTCELYACPVSAISLHLLPTLHLHLHLEEATHPPITLHIHATATCVSAELVHYPPSSLPHSPIPLYCRATRAWQAHEARSLALILGLSTSHITSICGRYSTHIRPGRC